MSTYQPLAPAPPARPTNCAKCGASHKGWQIRYCGPTQRVCSAHADETEHLIITCNVCGWATLEPCMDTPARETA